MTKLPRVALRALPMLALAACIETAPAPAADDEDLCGAAALAGARGQPRGGARTLRLAGGPRGLPPPAPRGQPAEVARTLQLPAGTRIINPGDPVTRDLRRDRLNIEIGADGNIARVACY